MKAFDDSMKSLFRLNGLELQLTATVFTLSVWESSNPSLTIILLYTIGWREQVDTGDVPTLVSNDEVDGLLEVIIYHVATDHVITVLC